MARRPRTEYLEHRSSGYFWRRRVPKFGKFDLIRFWVFSLRTHEATRARELAGRLTVLTDFAIDCARIRPMDTVDIHTVIADLVRWNLDEADRARRFGGPRSLDAALREQARFTVATETLRQAILLRDYSALREPIKHSLRRLGCETEEGSDLWQQLGHEAAHALIDTTEEIARRDRGEFSEKSFVFRSIQSNTRSVPLPSQPTYADPAALSFLSMPQETPAAPVPERPFAVVLPEPTHESAQPPEVSKPATVAAAPSAQTTEAVSTAPGSDDLPARSIQLAQVPSPAVETKVVKDAKSNTTGAKGAEEETDADEEGETDLSTAEATGLSPLKTRRRRKALSQDHAAALLGLSKADQRRCNAKLGNPNMPVADMIDSYLADREAGKSGKRVHETDSPDGRTPGQMENERSTGRLIKKFIGERPIIDITEKELVEVFNVIQRLPNNHARSNTETRHPRLIAEDHAKEEAEKLEILREKLRAQGQSEANIADIIEEVRTPLMAANTVYRKMQEVQRFFDHAIAHRHILFNPMDGVIWSSAEKERRVKADGDRSRIIWGNQLPKLFRTERFQSWSKNPFDALIWATIIAVFTGARMEEILQLKVADFDMTDAGLVMHIRAGTNQTLKTKNSARRLPIHSRLLELGLGDLLEHRRIQGERYLFPDLERDKHREKLSTFFSEEFTTFRKENEIYRKRMDFHSFRKGVNQQLLDNGVQRDIREALLGHKDNSINAKHYTTGIFPITDLREAVELLKFDTSMLQNPFKSLGSSNVTPLAAERFKLELMRTVVRA